MLWLYREVVEADDGVDEAVDILRGCGRPLESESVQDLCGVVVGCLNPSHFVAAAQVVGHEWTQQGHQFGILHHAVECWLEFFGLNPIHSDASIGKAVEDIGQILAMNIVGMEHNTLAWSGCQQHDGMCHLIDWRELEYVI